MAQQRRQPHLRSVDDPISDWQENEQRLSRLEGTLDVIRIWLPTIFFGILSIVIAVFIWQANSIESRLTALDQKITSLPGELKSLANAIANNINATRREPPIVIYTDTPSPPQEVRKPKPEPDVRPPAK